MNARLRALSRALPAAVAAGALVVSACGDDDAAGDAGGSPPPGPRASVVASPAADPTPTDSAGPPASPTLAGIPPVGAPEALTPVDDGFWRGLSFEHVRQLTEFPLALPAPLPDWLTFQGATASGPPSVIAGSHAPNRVELYFTVSGARGTAATLILTESSLRGDGSRVSDDQTITDLTINGTPVRKTVGRNQARLLLAIYDWSRGGVSYALLGVLEHRVTEADLEQLVAVTIAAADATPATPRSSPSP